MFTVVEAVADDETVWDIESDVVEWNVFSGGEFFANEDTSAEAERVEGGEEVLAEGVEGISGVKNIIEEEDMASGEVAEVLGEEG